MPLRTIQLSLCIDSPDSVIIRTEGLAITRPSQKEKAAAKIWKTRLYFTRRG